MNLAFAHTAKFFMQLSRTNRHRSDLYLNKVFFSAVIDRVTFADILWSLLRTCFVAVKYLLSSAHRYVRRSGIL